MNEVIKSYKGFNKDMTCRGKQYEEGKEYEEDRAKACDCGMHACEYPLDCFSYYSPSESVYHVVEQSGEISRRNGDSKIASTKMKIGAEISIAGLVKAAIEYTRERIQDDKESDEDYGASSATGNCGASSATGDYGASSATGNCGASSHRQQQDTRVHRQQQDTRVHRQQQETVVHRQQQETMVHRQQQETRVHRQQQDTRVHRQQQETMVHRQQQETVVHRQQQDTRAALRHKIMRVLQLHGDIMERLVE